MLEVASIDFVPIIVGTVTIHEGSNTMILIRAIINQAPTMCQDLDKVQKVTYLT